MPNLKKNKKTLPVKKHYRKVNNVKKVFALYGMASGHHISSDQSNPGQSLTLRCSIGSATNIPSQLKLIHPRSKLQDARSSGL